MNTQLSEHHFSSKQLASEEVEIKLAKENLSHFKVLYDRYYVRIFQYVYQRVQTKSQAADITSDTFVKAMENLKDYKFMGVPFASWLFRIARNEVYRQHKSNNNVRQVNFSGTNINDIADEIEHDGVDKLEILVTAIRQLTVEETELIEMKYFEKRSYFEIAEILEMTDNNAKVKTFRVVQKLKTIINP